MSTTLRRSLTATAAATTMAATRPPPPGFTAHHECTTSILLPDAAPSAPTSRKNEAFINPVQEYNRDLSVSVIRTWAKIVEREKRRCWETRVLPRRATKRKAGDRDGDGDGEDGGDAAPPPAFPPATFTVLEALSATGLRAIRYAKELPGLRLVAANDLSSSAVEAIKRNVEWNNAHTVTINVSSQLSTAEPIAKRIAVSQSDAVSLLYAHRKSSRILSPISIPHVASFDVIDIDPYGTAAPFIDGAVQAVLDGGLLCITCTDLAVLAGSSYPEKCFANYGGASMRAEYSHEGALRLVLHALSTSASRYSRYIEPVLSLSIDFYVRLFVRVRTSPSAAKKALTQTGLVYICSHCTMPTIQPFGKVTSKPNKSGQGTVQSFHNSVGPPQVGPNSKCTECDGTLHTAGPMWIGPLHSTSFLQSLLSDIDSAEGEGLPPLKTKTRIKGMTSVALSESKLDPDSSSLFFFTPSKLAGSFQSFAPSLSTFASALLNSGYNVSRSHCVAGSLKTTAPRSFVHDVQRKWIESHPVKMENVKVGNPARVLLAKPREAEVDFTHHPDVDEKLLMNVKLVRYQENPAECWGPGHKAKG